MNLGQYLKSLRTQATSDLAFDIMGPLADCSLESHVGQECKKLIDAAFLLSSLISSVAEISTVDIWSQTRKAMEIHYFG